VSKKGERLALNQKTAHDLLALYQSGQARPTEVVSALHSAIEAQDAELNAYLTVLPQARLEQQLENAPSGPLCGVPVAVKDLISTEGVRTTCGSQILKDFVPLFDATVVLKLKRAGAAVLGKTNLDEYGMGSSNENSSFGAVRNPHDRQRVAGGSSGGSAAAVAAHEAIVALGTDTGGSVRLPAAFCGVVGLKPTYGLVSRYGLIAYASSLDQVGPLTKDVRDAALVLGVIAGHDPCDSTSIERDREDYLGGLDQGVAGLKMGIPVEYSQGLSGEAAQRLDEWKARFVALGAEFIEVRLPHTPYAVPAYYMISCAEASANLARYDGVRYTARTSDRSLYDMYADTRDRALGLEVKRRIMLGTYALSAGYYDQYYGKAQKVRTLIKQDFDRAFERVDVLLAPTSPTPAFRLGEKVDDPMTMYLSDVYTVSVNLAGVPAISIPGGQVKGLPFGLQLIADKLQEGKLLRAAYAYEQSA